MSDGGGKNPERPVEPDADGRLRPRSPDAGRDLAHGSGEVEVEGFFEHERPGNVKGQPDFRSRTDFRSKMEDRLLGIDG